MAAFSTEVAGAVFALGIRFVVYGSADPFEAGWRRWDVRAE